jgi:hypothetical protein
MRRQIIAGWMLAETSLPSQAIQRVTVQFRNAISRCVGNAQRRTYQMEGGTTRP